MNNWLAEHNFAYLGGKIINPYYIFQAGVTTKAPFLTLLVNFDSVKLTLDFVGIGLFFTSVFKETV